MNILVTGVAGFIGSHVVDALISRGDKVIGIDNLDPYYSSISKLRNLSEISDKNFKYFCIDFNDYNALEKIFLKHNFDKIVHVGAKAGVRTSLKNPNAYVDANIKGTLNIFELARKNNINKIVLASSSSVYGNNDKVPFSETDIVDMPISSYAASKKSVELFAHVYHHLYGMDITCLRIFTAYGPRGRPDMAIYKFTKRIDEGTPIDMYGDGTSQRDYTFIEDIVSGIIASLDKEMGYEVINLGNSQTVELKKLISIIEENLGKKAIINKKPMQPGDVERTFADISKAKKLLGYNPQTNIEEGIKKFVEWYMSVQKQK
jgi:UDP-glucuronate 4-epimerase